METSKKDWNKIKSIYLFLQKKELIKFSVYEKKIYLWVIDVVCHLLYIY